MNITPELYKTITENDVAKWFECIDDDVKSDYLNSDEIKYISDYYEDAGLLTRSRQSFFRYHYVRPLAYAIQNLFSENNAPKILDLGCGTGTQSIFFALLGAKVIAIDMDTVGLEIFRKRIVHYEKVYKRKLNITILEANTLEFDYKSYGPFDGVYSLFAFNMMQPSSILIKKLTDNLSESAVIVIQDGNKEHLYNRIFRARNILTAPELAGEFKKTGFATYKNINGYCLPPFFWRVLPYSVCSFMDQLLSKIKILCVSYVHVIKK